MRLGPNLWDDPNYVLGTIRARAAGYDIFAISPGVSFTIRAAAGDTSVYNYIIMDLLP